MRAAVRHVSQKHSQLWEAVEECVYAYELDFRDGQPRPLNHYLPAGNAAFRQTLLVELIKVELELFAKQQTPRDLTDYPHRYPELGSLDDLPPDLIYEAYLAASRHGGDQRSLEEYCQDFPRQRAAILSLAQRTVNQSTAITRQKPGGRWQVGTRFGDFELQAVLGEGAFGQVFLAEQLSLGRQVALKVTANHSNEPRTMAVLKHESILQLFSEHVLPQFHARLLCMQYVPGTTLGNIVGYLADRPGDYLSGSNIIAAVDTLATVSAPLDTTSLSSRQQLANADRVASITLLGSQLARALAFAHKQGILHRDIKPDNILISRYGRPLLLDFNLSLDPHQVAGTSAGVFGGSLAYMSPEHLDALNPSHETSPDSVDERSDIFSLGVTLYELLHLRRPYPNPSPQTNPMARLEQLAHQRWSVPVDPTEDTNELAPLDHVILKCLAPSPEDRIQTAEELAIALESIHELHGMCQTLPISGRLMERAVRKPLAMLAWAVILPCLLGIGVHAAYSHLDLASGLSDNQSMKLLGGHLIVYAVGIVLLATRLQAGFHSNSNLDSDVVRRRIASLPLWVALWGLLSWLPTELIITRIIGATLGPIPSTLPSHFWIAPLLTSMIVATYSYFGVELIAIRVLYPRHLRGRTHPRQTACHELHHVPRRLQVGQIIAALIPIIAAALIVLPQPAGDKRFWALGYFAVAVVAIGVIGRSFSTRAASIVRQTLHALTD